MNGKGKWICQKLLNDKGFNFILSFYHFIILSFFITYYSFSQCGCPGSVPMGGTIPIGQTDKAGILNPGMLNINTFYRYTYGNDYYTGDSHIPNEVIQDYLYHYAGINASYGISNRLSAEAEIGYFFNKKENYDYYSLSANGFSTLILSGKYNIYYSPYDFEITAGAGLKIPMSQKPVYANQFLELPPTLQPSTMAYGAVIQLFLHKVLPGNLPQLYLYNRSEFNGTSNYGYRFGNSYATSLFISKRLTENLTGLLELSSNYRQQDKEFGQDNTSSGSFNFNISPHLNYNFDKMIISGMVDIPIYNYLYGKQMAAKYSLALMVSYYLDLKETEEAE